MIRRALLRQSRAVSSSTASSSRLSRATFQPCLSQKSLAARPPASFAASRLYSTEPEASKASESNAEPEGQQADATDPMKLELEKKDKVILELKDKYLRSVADFRNLQERTARDMKAAKDFAIQKFAKDLVESVDNLDRALSMVPEEKLKVAQQSEETKDLVNLYDGLKMTESILMNTLKKHGLERFDPSEDNAKFNPNEHEATFMTPMADKENDTVFFTQQKGFKLNGRILRAAKVGVVKNT